MEELEQPEKVEQKLVLDVNERFQQEEYTEQELKLVDDIFGIFTKNVYFSVKMHEEIPMDYNFINFAGISGSGKTVIKDSLKRTFQGEADNGADINVIDFDDFEYFDEKYGEMNIIELLEITDNKDETLKILSGFGLFEIRILLTPIKTLSTGQRKRLKYIYVVKQCVDNKTNHILMDEFLTFVDPLSSISFARTLQKYVVTKNAKLFTFGVNDVLVGQFEDITYILGNSRVNTVVDKGVIHYKHHLDYGDDDEGKDKVEDKAEAA